MASSAIPVVIIAGYLGSGKTTLLNRILATTTERIAVVVNDFGAINIDASLIGAQHGDTIELTNGCICCVVGQSLADVLLDILDRPVPPDAVFIEASGVADPASVATYAHIGGFRLNGKVVLVDCLHATDTRADQLVGPTFERQVRNADLLVLSKTDAASTHSVYEVRQMLDDLAVGVPVIDSKSLSVTDMFDLGTSTFATVNAQRHAAFSSTILDVPPLSSIDELATWLSDLPTNTVRVKGIVRLDSGDAVLVQRVGRHATITPTALRPTGLVSISAD